MTSTDLLTLAPLWIVAIASVVAMLGIAVRRHHGATAAFSLAGLALAFASIGMVGSFAPRQVTPLLMIDHYALFYFGLLLAASAAVLVLAYGYLEKQDINREELYVLLLVATLGSMVLAASSHFVSFFLGLEILSVSLYALNAYLRSREQPLEAGLKYLILAASSAAFLLFGMALIYAETGTMEFGRMAGLLAGSTPMDYTLWVPGLILILVGIGFKLALVPFHMWTPDVYEGAPAPVTAFIATVSKGGMFALLLRYFYHSDLRGVPAVFLVLSLIAVASMIVGNLLALLQENVKRILAYSSIAHMGYVLVAFLASGRLAAEAVTFYLVAYFITILGAFGILAVLATGEREPDRLEDLRGLVRRRPGLTAIFTAMLFSLAGIPLTAGFVGKFYVVAAGASATVWGLIFVLVVTSAIGLYYYLRIIVALYREPAEGAPEAAGVSPLSWSGGFVLFILTVLLIWFGVYPEALLQAIRHAAASLT